MLDDQTIREAVRRVVAAANAPQRVFLFGSYARGDATDRSDVDLLVVERELSSPGEEMIRLNDAVTEIDADIDIVVYSEAEFETRRDWCSSPVYWALREGKVLYGSLASLAPSFFLNGNSRSRITDLPWP